MQASQLTVLSCCGHAVPESPSLGILRTLGQPRRGRWRKVQGGYKQRRTISRTCFLTVFFSSFHFENWHPSRPSANTNRPRRVRLTTFLAAGQSPLSSTLQPRVSLFEDTAVVDGHHDIYPRQGIPTLRDLPVTNVDQLRFAGVSMRNHNERQAGIINVPVVKLTSTICCRLS